MTTEQLVTGLNVAALVAIMLAMGLQVSHSTLLSAIRQRQLMFLCVVGNFLLVPLVTLGLIWLFQANTMVAVGFMILAVCPGAPVGPPLTALGKGDLSIAIGMMVVLAALSSILSPLLLGFLISKCAPEADLHIDFLTIARTLVVSQLVPLAIGLAIHHWAPALTRRIARPVGLLSNVLMLALIVTIIATQYHMLADIRLRGWIGMAILLAASLAIGWLLGGSKIEMRRTSAITTGPRNAAVGLAIANGSFANTPAVTAVVAYGLVSMLGTMAFAMAISRRGGAPTRPVETR